MTFIVNAYDHKDENALNRRMEVREAHLNGIKKLYEKGHIWYAAAMLNEDGNMCGSTLIMEFESRSELDVWLDHEPYMTNRVWEKIDVILGKVPDMFKD